ncbi:MAG: hypothetical protein AAF689_16530 [Pseudomonadota bacterium]
MSFFASRVPRKVGEIVASAAIALASVAQADTLSAFRFDGVCLAVNLDENELYSPGFALRSGSPFLLAPAPYATPELTDAPDRTGIGVFYRPITDRDRARRLADRERSEPGDCIETPFDFGLARVTDDPAHTPRGTDPITCAASDIQIDLVPEATDIPLDMRCPGDMRTGSCWASYYLDENWEARFLISPEYLAEWPTFLRLVETFFDTEIQPCTP